MRVQVLGLRRTCSEPDQTEARVPQYAYRAGSRVQFPMLHTSVSVSEPSGESLEITACGRDCDRIGTGERSSRRESGGVGRFLSARQLARSVRIAPRSQLINISFSFAQS